MRTRHVLGALGCATLLALPAALHAQFTVPNIVTGSADVVSVLGKSLFINHGLVGAGRIPASIFDGFGESFGSVSGLQITNWTRVGDSYAGTFNILPDRGYNSGTFFSDYAARIQQVSFVFTPHTGGAIGGTDIASKLAAQKQIMMTSMPSGVKFQYFDVIRNTPSPTTGLDRRGFTAPSRHAPYVVGFNGPSAPGKLDEPPGITAADRRRGTGAESRRFRIRRRRYGANIYYSTAAQIVGVVGSPKRFAPANIRRQLLLRREFRSPRDAINQGLRASRQPGRTRAPLQSAAMCDSAAAQTRLQTWLLVYDVRRPHPSAPVAEHADVAHLSPWRRRAVNATAAQSEIVALDNQRPCAVARRQRSGNATYNAPLRSAACRRSSRACPRRSTLGSPTNSRKPTRCRGRQDHAVGRSPGERRGPGHHEGSGELAEFHSARQLQLRDRCRRHDAGQPADA